MQTVTNVNRNIKKQITIYCVCLYELCFVFAIYILYSTEMRTYYRIILSLEECNVTYSLQNTVSLLQDYSNIKTFAFKNITTKHYSIVTSLTIILYVTSHYCNYLVMLQKAHIISRNIKSLN